MDSSNRVALGISLEAILLAVALRFFFPEIMSSSLYARGCLVMILFTLASISPIVKLYRWKHSTK